MEYLVITAFFVIVAAIFFTYAFITFSENKSTVLGGDAVARIAGNANLVASMGEGSTLYFDAELPETAKELVLWGNYVKLNYNASAGTSNSYAYTKVGLSPKTIVVSGGRRQFRVALEDGNVLVE
ncbi:Uncharacterised protein [uncultured archaeon]|nr:Uncharacterised protein [uncultured archaeon]